MDLETRRLVAKVLRDAANTLEGRGPTHPQAIFRFGSKPNQAPVMRFLREFLDEYAAAGNELMQGKHPGERVERLQNLATRISMDLDELIASVEALYP